MGSWLIDIMAGQDNGGAARIVRGVLSALEKPYRAAIAVRNATFDSKLRLSRPAGRVTISVGNLTTGGTGKTPMVVEIVQRLQRAGATPAVLLRGYKRTADKSDEQMVLAESLGPDVPVVANPNRMAGANAALQQNPKVDVFVLDDGFQHRQVHRDLDLVLIDATQPFGFEHVLPRGLLREPPRALRRADAVIVTRADQVDADRLARLDGRIELLTGKRPIGHAAHEWVAFYDVHDVAHPLTILSDRRVAAVCAIGNPQPFFETLRRYVGEVVSQVSLPDHYAYSREEIDRLMRQAVESKAEALVLTEKDWVKWMPWVDAEHLPLPIYHPKLRLRMLDGDEALNALLLNVLDKR